MELLLEICGVFVRKTVTILDEFECPPLCGDVVKTRFHETGWEI